MGRKPKNRSNGIATAEQLRSAYNKQYILHLPFSDVDIVIKRISLMECMRVGMLPMDMLMESYRKFEGVTESDVPNMDKKDIGNFTGLLEKVACTASVAPLFVPRDVEIDPNVDAVHVTEIVFEDLMAIFNSVSGGGEDLKPFLGGAEQPVGNRPVGEAVRSETKSSDGNK